MKLSEKGVVYKTSRISFVSNYILLILVVVLLSLIWPYLNLSFSLTPRNINELYSTMFVFGFILVITFLIEQPTIERIIRHYIVTNHEVTKVEGLLRKNKLSIPYQSVADIRMQQGIVGRILNFGNVVVTGVVRSEKSGGVESILIKGIRRPEEAYKIIQNKINLMRGALIESKK